MLPDIILTQCYFVADNSMSSKELQDLVSALMVSKEQLRQLKGQVRHQNEVIQMLINRTSGQSISGSGRFLIFCDGVKSVL